MTGVRGDGGHVDWRVGIAAIGREGGGDIGGGAGHHGGVATGDGDVVRGACSTVGGYTNAVTEHLKLL